MHGGLGGLSRARSIGQQCIHAIEARHYSRRRNGIVLTIQRIDADIRLAVLVDYLDGVIAQSFVAWVEVQAQQSLADDAVDLALTRSSILT